MKVNIASERMRLGLTQEDLSNELGVSKSTVLRWEQGIGKPDSGQLVAMHYLFKCSTDYLLGLTDERKPFATH